MTEFAKKVNATWLEMGQNTFSKVLITKSIASLNSPNSRKQTNFINPGLNLG